VTDLADVDAIVNDMLTPLRETLARIDAEIAEHEAAIARLKQARAKPARILAAAERTPKAPGPKPGAKKTSNAGVAPDKLAALTDWLHANTNGEAFHASGIDRREDFTLMSQATLSHALSVLADQGVIRLDHRGSGGAKFYKLVEATRG
jgi:DNA-binding transcriptional ArsR family regulator